jgi:hypothetical protein
VTDLKEGNYYCIVRLYLLEQARVVRNGATFAAESWRSHQLHTWGNGKTELNFDKQVGQLLNDFLNDYLAINQ